MRAFPESVIDQFSLVEGNPIYRFEVWLTALMPDRTRVAAKVLLAVTVAWLPLLLLSFLPAGQSSAPNRIPLLQDFATTARLLVALPLLIAGEAVIDPQIRIAARHFVTSNLVMPDALPAYEEIIRRSRRLCDSSLSAAALILAAFTPALWWKGWESASGELAGPAAAWFQFISIPLFRLMLLRWLWLLAVWTIFLCRVAKLPLYCVASHPDRAGGLGFLRFTQLYFGPVPFAISAAVAGGVANMLVHQGASLESKKFLLAGCGVLGVLLTAAPLLVFTPMLLAVKQRGLWRYGALGAFYTQRFDEKWIQGEARESESLLGAADIQSLADVANSFDVVRQMKLVLVSKEMLLGLGFVAFLPILVMLVAVTPVDALIRSIAKLVG